MPLPDCEFLLFEYFYCIHPSVLEPQAFSV